MSKNIGPPLANPVAVVRGHVSMSAGTLECPPMAKTYRQSRLGGTSGLPPAPDIAGIPGERLNLTGVRASWRTSKGGGP